MQAVTYEYSAGGVIVDQCRVVLIRTRTSRGRRVWTFPKGRLEAGETDAEAALREVWEETGYTCRLKQPLGATTYWFRAGETQVKKTVHWFLLEVSEKTGAFNRTEVEEVRWVPIRQAYEKLSHRGDRRLLAGVQEQLGCR
jgi:8-oxo-dGTP pyrophosphatase MutT (NUDIX family)